MRYRTRRFAGAVVCWNDEYHFDFWRPWNAISRAAEDGNPAYRAGSDLERAHDRALPGTIPRATSASTVHTRSVGPAHGRRKHP